MIQSKDSLKQVVSRVDTLYIDRIDPKYHESYIQLLEKSNEQLSLVGNPLAWMIGSLGVLFTVGAIVTAYLLWRQSKEFREEQRSLLVSANNEIKQLQDNLKNQSDILLGRLTASVTEIEERNLSLDLPEKETLINQINNLKSDLNKIKSSNHEFDHFWKTIDNDQNLRNKNFEITLQKLHRSDQEAARKLNDKLKKL